MDQLTFRGFRLAYELTDVGSRGASVVLIHGLGCDSGFWSAQVEDLKERARVLAVDLPGHGASDCPDADYSMGFYAAAVEAAMDRVGFEHAVVVGHSLGAPIARALALRSVARVSGLVAVDGLLVMLPVFQTYAATMLKSLEGDGFESVFAAQIESLLGEFMDEGTRERVRAAMVATPRHVVVRSMRQMYEESLWKPMACSAPAVSLMAATAVLPPGYSSALTSEFPRCAGRRVEATGHFIMLDRPDEVTRTVLDLLAESGD